MEAAVVGGGIVGLFSAWNLAREGAEVTVYDREGPGAGSVHAAGIIEPATAYRTNTFAFLRRLRRFWRSGTCTFRSVDPRWAFESVRQLERRPLTGSDEAIDDLSRVSVSTYRALAESQNDFDFAERGLLERFDDPRHFSEQRDEALSRKAVVPVEVRSDAGAGALFFPEVGRLDTGRFVERICRELPKVHWFREEVRQVRLDGTVTTRTGRRRFDAIVVSAGVACRRLGVPLTGVRGYGWRVRTRQRTESAVIHVDRGIAVVPLTGEVKATGGWDFDLGTRLRHAPTVLDAIRRVVEVDEVLGFAHGTRPCTPDGLPTVARRDRVVVATGGFRLGWSFAPGLGLHAARLAMGRDGNQPFLARFGGGLRSGTLG